MERWTFGVEPLPQALVIAPLLRRVTGLIQSLEHEDPAVAQLVEDLRTAVEALRDRVPADPAPRLGVDAAEDRRPYVDHARDIGGYNPSFPEYEILVEGSRASGTVTFPVVFEGPPGVVHGGVVATFFDCVVQHHNCDVGVGGKTTSLAVPLNFEIDRVTNSKRITSHARLFVGDDTLCTATMEAVAGDRSRLPHVSPRRPSS